MKKKSHFRDLDDSKKKESGEGKHTGSLRTLKYEYYLN